MPIPDMPDIGAQANYGSGTLPLVGGGLGMLGDFFGGLLGLNSAAKQNRENRAWQERMRNTQYQATVADMKKAGINPMALFHGSSLSQGMSPSGVQPQQQFAEGLSKASGKLSETLGLKANLDLMRANTASTLAGLRKTNSETEGQNTNNLIRKAELDYTLKNLELDYANRQKMGENTVADTERLRALRALADAQSTSERIGFGKLRFDNSLWGIGLHEAQNTLPLFSPTGILGHFGGPRNSAKNPQGYRSFNQPRR